MGKISKKLTRKEVLSVVKEGGDAFKNASEKYRDDREIVLAAINVWPANLEFASKRLRKDKKLVKTAFKLDRSTILNADESLRVDHKFLKDLEKISYKIWNYASSPEYEKEKEIEHQKRIEEKRIAAKKKLKKREKLLAKNKLKSKKTLSDSCSFFFRGELTMINLYAGGACFDVKDSINNKVNEFWIGDDEELYDKIIKSKNGLRFTTGRDMFYYSYLYVDKKGKVKKIFIEVTPDLRDLVSDSLDLIYNDQFVYQLSLDDNSKIKDLMISNSLRKKISEVAISSGYIQIGQRAFNEKPHQNNKSEVIINFNPSRAGALESFNIPVKNKNYPVYAYVYNYQDNEDGLEEITDNILIVVEDIEGCYLNRINDKQMHLSNKP